MFSKKSVILSWTYSYIMVLLIPMLAIFVNYRFNAQVLEKEVIRVNEQTLTNLQGYVDGILEREIAMYDYLRANDSFIEIMKNDTKNKYFYNDIADLKDVLADHPVNDARFSSMIYFIDKDYVLDSVAGGISRSFYHSKDFLNCKNTSYENWTKHMSQVYDKKFFTGNIFRRDTHADQIIYADTVTLYKNRSANIFIFFPLSEITKLTENSTSQILLEVDGEYIFYMSEGIQKNVPEDIEKSVSGEVLIGEESYICLSQKSSVGNLSYKMLIPEQEIKQEFLYTRNVLLVCVVLAIILSGLCVAILLRYNMRPLVHLLNKLGAKELKGNEYTQIEEIYNTISQQNISMQREILKKDQKIRNVELLDLMKGRKGSGAEKLIPDELQAGKELGLVGFKVQLYDQDKIQHDEAMYAVVDNIFSELMNGQEFYKAHDGQHIFFLFVIDKEQESQWRQTCLEKMRFLYDFIEEKTHSQIIAVLCDDYGQTCEDIRFLYREVMEGFEYIFNIGEAGVVNLADLNLEGIQHDFMTTIELAMQKRTSEEMLDGTAKIFREMDRSSLRMAQILVLEIFQKLLLYVNKYITDEVEARGFLQYLEVLLEVESKERVKQVLKDILLYAYKFVNLYQEKSQNSIVENIKEYVVEHYADKGLNVKEIALDLGWNPRYMARVFREEMNEGILDYINHVRISKAVILLNDRSLSIEEVSEQVGYTSSDTFRRIFKQKMGVAPNKYKR